MVATDQQAAVLKLARASLWRRREVWPLLQVYLDRDQFADAQAIFAGCDIQRMDLPKADFCLDISRQRGKSWLCCAIAGVLCHCLRGFLVNYSAQEQKSVRAIVEPTLAAILEDCPLELRPSFDSMDNVWEWRGMGSRIRAFGCNQQRYKAGRGPRSHLNIEDECGFYDEYDAVQAVLAPQLQTTGGFTIYASTPPETPSHPHSTTVETHKIAGRHSHRTIYGHPRMSPEEVDMFLAKEAAKKGMTLEQFKRTTYFRREYLAMHVVEATKAVVPEWTEPANPLEPDGTTWGAAHVREFPRPLFFDAYDGLDIGFTRDPSAWIGGYWDWSSARLVIEAETPPLYRTRADALAQAILEQRRMLWPCPGPRPSREAKKSPCGTYWLPWASVGDGSGNGAEKLVELQGEGLHFQHAEKPDLESRVNELRTLIAAGKLWVHPRCKNLREQLATGLWADKHAKNDFERTEKGHLDHLAALVDLVHAIDRNRRPVPVDYGVDTHNTAHDGTRPMSYTPAAQLNNALGSVEWE